jgi:Terpene synthase family 2, C-terminal metal binding
MGRISLPEPYCPFAPRVNPHGVQAWPQTVGWASRFKLIPERELPHFRALDFHELSARAFPDAGLRELVLINDWMTLFYLFDKQWDNAQPEVLAAGQAMLLDGLRGRSNPCLDAGPLRIALEDLRHRMMAFGSERWMERFSRSIEEYFKACVWEARNKTAQAIPDIASYIRMRELTGAVQPSFELAGVLRLAELSPEMMEEPALKRLNMMANHVICWFNDIVSLEKELLTGEIHNLVLLIQRESGSSLEKALQQAAKMHDDELRAFIELEQALPSWGEPIDAGVRRYVDVVRCWIRANVDWSLGSERYRVS